jgi:hypothetical protein
VRARTFGSLLLIVAFACADWQPAGARADEGDARAQKERAALLAYMKQKGVDLRVAEHRSNVISHMYTVGPEHAKRYLVGLTYHPQALNAAEVTAKYAIAIPFVFHKNWALWQVGGPGGNATQDYLAIWERVRSAFKDYPATTPVH